MVCRGLYGALRHDISSEIIPQGKKGTLASEETHEKGRLEYSVQKESNRRSGIGGDVWGQAGLPGHENQAALPLTFHF